MPHQNFYPEPDQYKNDAALQYHIEQYDNFFMPGRDVRVVSSLNVLS
jgi:hypothetical protein